MHQVPASETARCKMVKVPKAAVACQPAAWRLSWHRCTRKKARFRESALLNVGISINAYPYHSMLLPIEYYKTRGHFPTSCSHTQEFRRFRIQIVLSRSKSVLAHWPKSHASIQTSQQSRVWFQVATRVPWRNIILAQLFLALGYCLFFFAILQSRSCASLTRFLHQLLLS